MNKLASGTLLAGLTAGAALLLVAATAAAPQRVHTDKADERASFRFDNGRWFDGERFVEATVFVEHDRLRFARNRKEARASAEETIDLDGAYVTPPFCEAHNHNLGSDWENDVHIYNYLRDGVFYVKILSNLPRESATVWGAYNLPTSVDAAFANGGVTGPGGHPIKLRETLLARGIYEGFTKETLRDHAYYVIASEADIEAKWPLIMQYRPDFLKLFLLHSEEYAGRRDDPKYFGDKGLSPELFAKLVDKAHALDIPVAVHIETAHDFHVAVEAGADNIAHLPGLREPERINAEDAAEAARRGIVVTTTAHLVNRVKERDPALYAKIREAQIANLRLLKDAGVTLSVGSDEYDDTSVKEVAYLRSLDVFEDAEILRMWTENCAATTFPKRRIGRLADGYEASFIALGSNPLADFDATNEIELRVKDGAVLDIGPPPPAPSYDED